MMKLFWTTFIVSFALASACLAQQPLTIYWEPNWSMGIDCKSETSPTFRDYRLKRGSWREDTFDDDDSGATAGSKTMTDGTQQTGLIYPLNNSLTVATAHKDISSIVCMSRAIGYLYADAVQTNGVDDPVAASRVKSRSRADVRWFVDPTDARAGNLNRWALDIKFECHGAIIEANPDNWHFNQHKKIYIFSPFNNQILADVTSTYAPVVNKWHVVGNVNGINIDTWYDFGGSWTFEVLGLIALDESVNVETYVSCPTGLNWLQHEMEAVAMHSGAPTTVDLILGGEAKVLVDEVENWD